MSAFNKATEYLKTKTEDECLFVKILYTKQETSILNRNNFRLLATAATIVAQFEQSSFTFYRGGHIDSVSGALELVITKYLTMRLNMALHAMSASTYARKTE
jgi:hypothetical protein